MTLLNNKLNKPCRQRIDANNPHLHVRFRNIRAGDVRFDVFYDIHHLIRR